MSDAAPTLKCVIAWSDRRNLCDLVGRTLDEAGESDALRLNEDSWVVCSSREPAELRGVVASALEGDESVFVVEFDRWSAHGAGVDSTWLLRRGH